MNRRVAILHSMPWGGESLAGVTEVCTDDLTMGERELRSMLVRTAGASAEEVVAAVERRAVELHGDARRDDIALVAVRVCATAG
jgi:serine phosphatase RsbU (regulator of sigma subunit)